MRFIFIWLVVLFSSLNVYAADLLDQTEDTTPTADDMLYCVNDPAGTPADRKCTVGNVAKGMTSTNLIDTAAIVYETEIDTLAELDTKVADAEIVDLDNTQTLTNKTISGSVNTITNINGENITDDTIDDDSIDFGTGADQVSGADFANEDLGDISISTGSWTLDANTVATNELADFGTLTATAARMLIADGTDFESVAISGDITVSSAGATTIGNDKVLETHFKAVDAAADEECLTYESTTGDFEWQTCGGGGGLSNVVEDITPQLGGNLDVNGQSIVSASSGNIVINPDGTGTIRFSDLTNCDTIDTDAEGDLACGTDASGSGGTANILDLGDDGGNDSTDLIEIATTGDTNNIFTEPTADKLLITLSNDWPKADLADALAANPTDCSANQYATTIAANGNLTCAQPQLNDLSDIGTVAVTAGRILVADGTDFEAVAVSGDATLAASGALTLANDSVATAELADFGTLTATAAQILVADGTDFESVAMSGDVTIASNGSASLAADSVATAEMADADHGDFTYSSGSASLDTGVVATNELADFGTLTATAGRVLVADGTDFESVAMGGDATISSAGTVTNDADLTVGGFGITIDGGGSAITTGIKGYIEVPYACTINRVTMLADASGSAVVDVWKDTYANYPPTDADTITASAPPTISSATKSQDSTLTGWTTSVTAGDVLGFNVDSATTIARLHVHVRCEKNP